MKRFTKPSPFQQLLMVLVAFITAMIICRVIYSGSIRFVFLLWNLFLAWIPFQLSQFLLKKNNSHGKNAFLIAGWLLFFPNALYIITDLVHLEGRSKVPTWFDAVLLLTAANTGLMLAFASLYKIEVFLTRQINKAVVNKLVIGCIFLGSFGVYLGRFLRWNSWDILLNPLNLLNTIGRQFLFPVQHYQTWAITLLLTVFFSLLYFGIKRVYPPASFLQERKT